MMLKDAAAKLREILRGPVSRDRDIPRVEQLLQLFSRANYAEDVYISSTIQRARADFSDLAKGELGNVPSGTLYRNARASVTELDRLIAPDGDSLQSP